MLELLSISIPTFNRAQYLSELLDSIEKQVVADVSILDQVKIYIYDNAPEDNTVEIIKRFSFPFHYKRNAQSISDNPNVLQAYTSPHGEYVWVIGVNKIQWSLDSLSLGEHDQFRAKSKSHERALWAIDASLNVGLNIIIQTVVTSQGLRSQEFVEFLEFLNGKGVSVFVTYTKPVGAWEENFGALVTRDDTDEDFFNNADADIPYESSC